MPRSPVTTRLATVADVPVLLGLWKELRQVGGRAERAIYPIAVPDIAVRLAQAVGDEECQIVIASTDGEPAGMVVCRVVRPDPLSDGRIFQIAHLFVAAGQRRRGVGRALLAAVADLAEAEHVEHVGVGVYQSLRDTSRFYARLGFAPVLVQRIAPVTVLRRRLGGSESGLLRVEDLVRRRTRMRRPLPAQRPGRRAPEPVAPAAPERSDV